MEGKICTTPDCGKKADRRINGEPACQACYRRFRRHGSTENKHKTKGRTPPMSWDVVYQNSDLDEETGCRIWNGSTDRDGYPRYYDSALYDAGSSNCLVYVRRWVLEQEGHTLGRRYIADDICGKRLCVEKTHLLVATYTSSSKTLAALNARKLECVNGHPFTAENTYIAKGNRRKCKQCAWESQMRHLGKDPSQHVRGLANGVKEYCPRGHLYEGENLYTDAAGNRHCIACRRINHIRRKYGLSEEEYNALRVSQDHLCAICGTDLDKLPVKEVVVDHCHNSNRVRGILCGACNTGLGMFRDNTDSLRRAIDYLNNAPE